MSKRVDRRRALATLAASFGALPLAGCDLFSQNPTVRKVLDSAESLTMHAQRLLLSRQALAQEFTEADISADFRANGSTDPDDDAYQTFPQSGFKDWRLQLDGLVERPVQLSLGDLRALPARTQITRHDCVEGWSCISKWTGVPLSIVLQEPCSSERETRLSLSWTRQCPTRMYCLIVAPIPFDSESGPLSDRHPPDSSSTQKLW